MGILNAARSHFGTRWKSDIRLIGPDAFQLKLDELQREIIQLQQCCQRLRMANRREPNRAPSAGSDIRVISERVEAELATLHGWTVSLVESLFVLVGLETDEETELRQEWKRSL